MNTTEAIGLLSNFINLYTDNIETDKDKSDRELYHEALSCLEDKAIRFDNLNEAEGNKKLCANDWCDNNIEIDDPEDRCLVCSKIKHDSEVD